MKKQKTVKCPFIGPDGQVKSPFRAILDRCIIWPTPPPERVGLGIIEIPEMLRHDFQDNTGILLSVGPGYWSESIEGGPRLQNRFKMRKPGENKTRTEWHPVNPGYWDEKDGENFWHVTDGYLLPGVMVYFDNSVPWGAQAMGLDGKTYNLVICTVQDIQGVLA